MTSFVKRGNMDFRNDIWDGKVPGKLRMLVPRTEKNILQQGDREGYPFPEARC